MPPQPRISVLLPVRDAAASLPACLRSIARQSERAFECVVVDDGSRDRSGDVARRAARDDPRFRVIATPKRGLVAALETGLAACRAPLVARMDADDCMHRDRLAAQRRALEEQPSLSGVGCHVRLFPRRTLGAGMRAYEHWLATICGPDDVRREAFVECPLVHPTLLVRTAALRGLGYRDAGWPEDYDLVLRALARGHAFGVVPRRLLLWRHEPRRLSQTSPVYADDRFIECKAHFLARSFLGRGEDYVLWGYGRTGRRLARALRARGKRPTAIVELHPGRLGQRIHGAPVIPPGALGAPTGLPLVVSVARAEPRAEVRAELARRGWREGADFVCAA